MTRTEKDTEPLPATDPAERRPECGLPRPQASGDSAKDGSEPWLGGRTYRFASVEGSLLAVTCVVSLAMATEVWPVVELDRRHLRLRWPERVEPTPHQSRVWAELEGWVRHLGGLEVAVPESEGRELSLDI